MELLALALLFLAPGLAWVPRPLLWFLGLAPFTLVIFVGLPLISWLVMGAFSVMGWSLGRIARALGRPGLAWSLWWAFSLLPLWLAPLTEKYPGLGGGWFLWPGAFLVGEKWDPARSHALYSLWDSVPLMGVPGWAPAGLILGVAAGLFWVARRCSVPAKIIP